MTEDLVVGDVCVCFSREDAGVALSGLKEARAQWVGVKTEAGVDMTRQRTPYDRAIRTLAEAILVYDADEAVGKNGN